MMWSFGKPPQVSHSVPTGAPVRPMSRRPPSDTRKSAPAALLLILLFSMSPALAEEADNQFWPQIDAFVKMSARTRVYIRYNAQRTADLEEYSDGKIGAFLDFYAVPLLGRHIGRHVDAARTKSFMIRAGYMLDRTHQEGAETTTTNMPVLETTGRMQLPGAILMSDRNRVDFRFENGDYHPRYRNRLQLEHKFETGRFELIPYANAEAFYYWQYDKFSRFRYAAGLEWVITHRIVLEGYYMRQRDTEPSEKSLNVLGVDVHFYLR